MKLCKRDTEKLQNILAELERGEAFLLREDTLLCHTKKAVSTTLDYQNAQGEVCYSFDKRIGSEFQILQNGIAHLRQLLTPVIQEVEL
jgi:hypothetical protein